MDISPRQLIALFRAGELEEIMKSRTIWICASCYACTTRCPAGIKITDMIYALKRTAIEKGIRVSAPHVQRMARLFTRVLIRYGRLHEGSLIGWYYLRTHPFRLFSLLPLAKKMIRTKRLDPLPHRIKAHAQLARIIRKAERIDMRQSHEPLGYAPAYVGYRGLGDLQLEQRKGT
jgi:heterodisulfide reductase subunit C